MQFGLFVNMQTDFELETEFVINKNLLSHDTENEGRQKVFSCCLLTL